MFKENDYIVLTKIKLRTSSFLENWIIKQNRNSQHLEIYLDCQYDCSAWSIFKFDKSDTRFDWRYATFEEIEEYDRIGKPYNVTTLNQFVLPEKWCVIDTDDEQSDDLYEYATKYGAMPPYAKNIHHKKQLNFYHFPSINGCTTCSNLETGYTLITINQFKRHVLNQKVIKENMFYLINVFKELNIQ